MPLIFNTIVPLASLSRVGLTRGTTYLFDNEEFLYQAYLDRYETAKILGLPAHKHCLYFDAWYILHFSVECFLKYLYCLVRENVYAATKPSGSEGKAPADFSDGFLFRQNKAPARMFSHDAWEVARFLMEFSDASNARQHPEFLALVRELKKGTGWNEFRYDNRKHTDYKTEFEDLFKSFESVLSGCCRGIR